MKLTSDVPSTPPKPVCIPANAKADEMYVGIQPAAAHGAPLLEYEVSISTASADLRYVGRNSIIYIYFEFYIIGIIIKDYFIIL